MHSSKFASGHELSLGFHGIRWKFSRRRPATCQNWSRVEGVKFKIYMQLQSSYLRCLWKHGGKEVEGGNGFHNFCCKFGRIVPQLDHDMWDTNYIYKISIYFWNAITATPQCQQDTQSFLNACCLCTRSYQIFWKHIDPQWGVPDTLQKPPLV